jgi:hypothetical protein
MKSPAAAASSPNRKPTLAGATKADLSAIDKIIVTFPFFCSIPRRLMLSQEITSWK